MATATTSVKKAFDTQDDLKSRREHCAVAARTLASLDRVRGQQVRVHHDAEFALYTVSELLHETTDVRRAHGVARAPAHRPGRGVRAASSTRRSPIPTCATRTPAPPASSSSGWTTTARRRTSSPSRPTVAASSRTPTSRPSGCADRLGSQLASAWRCKGWGPNGGAFARWHITSTDIDPASFPLLATVASRRFARAVAFHGFDDEAGSAHRRDGARRR